MAFSQERPVVGGLGEVRAGSEATSEPLLKLLAEKLVEVITRGIVSRHLL